MKHWPSQLFPIILLGALAALTFWLQKVATPEATAVDKIVRHEIDAVAENFVARRFDIDGQIKYKLTAPSMVHFADDDSSELRAPVLLTYRKNAPPVTLAAHHARVTAKGETVHLWEEVIAIRPPIEHRPALVARMPDLTAYPNAGTATTDSPVEITEGRSWLTGVGADLDHNASTFVLRSQVRGAYLRPGIQP